MPAKKKPAAAAPSESAELSLIRKLAEILNDTGLSEIELDHKGAKVRVSKTLHAAPMVHVAAPAHHAPSSPTPHSHAATAAPVAAVEMAGTPLKSPMVGTAYLSPSPEAPAFAAIGSMVKQGQTLLIIEAMKTMNQIAAPKSGKLVQVMVENAQPVEFGEVLMVIE
ncbi:acetyl-CoA carboxylase biotin carboxyl carrier protein [Aestuariivirga litoralis]|uniref:acetyl-CoA carboxylase biotin carboxyl carrier protein n=1 Tax=Aestuariivirga litoralis TaxID=2650924 RepID=UPI0018C5CA7F|nr:acetyl-CoA carboxylase biotin carboxyl carrier protein [Aestuariivirga litoralis]MBG1231912.1 acetyl-CoA carboxylase biotin carboxyl carrier protein [Aestuariivirga litoralis]